MITPKCPQCSRILPVEDVNVGNDVAFCRSCNVAHALSDMVHEEDITSGVNFNDPPRGISYDAGYNRLELTASQRSIGGALGTLFISLFWNGIVSIFVLLALSSTLSLGGVPTPAWFPAPEMNDSDMGWGMTIFLWLFLTPFILIGLAMISAFFMCLGGRTVVKIDGEDGKIFSGVGPIGWTKHFTRSEVTDVRIDTQYSSTVTYEFTKRRSRSTLFRNPPAGTSAARDHACRFHLAHHEK